MLKRLKKNHFYLVALAAVELHLIDRVKPLFMLYQ